MVLGETVPLLGVHVKGGTASQWGGGVRGGRHQWDALFISIGTETPTESSKPWCQLFDVLYYIFRDSAQSCNCFSGTNQQYSETLPQRTTVGLCHTGSVKFVVLKLSHELEIKYKNAVAPSKHQTQTG